MENWRELMNDVPAAMAILDRLMTNAELLPLARVIG
jgi:hypothetical protein